MKVVGSHGSKYFCWKILEEKKPSEWNMFFPPPVEKNLYIGVRLAEILIDDSGRYLPGTLSNQFLMDVW